MVFHSLGFILGLSYYIFRGSIIRIEGCNFFSFWNIIINSFYNIVQKLNSGIDGFSHGIDAICKIDRDLFCKICTTKNVKKNRTLMTYKYIVSLIITDISGI